MEKSEVDIFRTELVAMIPGLRAFAYTLAGGCQELADDLAQEALAKAWAARATFTVGTNLRAWIFRILRNHFYTTARIARRFVLMDPGFADDLLVQPPAQGGKRVEEDIERGLATLPVPQREALMLLASGLSWNEIAEIMECPIGTVKSRITRGRLALKAYLDGPREDHAETNA